MIPRVDDHISTLNNFIRLAPLLIIGCARSETSMPIIPTLKGGVLIQDILSDSSLRTRAILDDEITV